MESEALDWGIWMDHLSSNSMWNSSFVIQINQKELIWKLVILTFLQVKFCLTFRAHYITFTLSLEMFSVLPNWNLWPDIYFGKLASKNYFLLIKVKEDWESHCFHVKDMLERILNQLFWGQLENKLFLCCLSRCITSFLSELF